MLISVWRILMRRKPQVIIGVNVYIYGPYELGSSQNQVKQLPFLVIICKILTPTNIKVNEILR